MEANICDINHLDADVLLPPRKRLLAGFKKQSSDGDAALAPVAVASSSSSSAASPSSPAPTLSPSPLFPSPPSPTPCSPSSSEFQARLNNLLTSHFNNNHNLSPDQIVEASKSAAEAAVKAAEAARAAAQEKAIIATKAVTAAKSALALVASFPGEAASKERCLKKNKLKKHVQVQLLYKKHQPIENYRDDEELARKLHRVINSSPRISKNSSSSDLKGHKNKKPKSSPTSERTRVSNGSVVFGGNLSPMCNGHAIAGELDSEGSIDDEACTSTADEKTSKFEKAAQLEMDNGEAESSHSKDKVWGDASSPGKRRGRLKLRKLPLSICSSRDQAKPKDDIFPRSSPLADKNMANPTTRNKPLFSMEPSANNPMAIDVPPMRKCQEFKSPASVKQNKVIQS
ncbi:uncharacterized protein LOC110609268 [Manihot esculenta]|uniref:Uncharacterized protein n=2 Tax=Manihot esculenta TaxID=3983 RepID=A0A251M1U7_MANES|nr:uncharacterized protein LOC110609268 [Manihot esculenta]XP_021604547.1 uncharacterized protein LOC110609268 [Manihot esculenta]KAG8662893.1 hypothetical protein MANES_01G155700v8 [Manihot esculenta]OAY60998.1 hypothetical protein MANES_01G155700v8 [Manihot esculenta]OAY60999.1 hypothetical protein MANES_01G155700v8 [Manihot esculenta]